MASTGNTQSSLSPTSSSYPEPSSRSQTQWQHDVFLSFRGDTRNNITDHLYDAFVDKGIRTFKDDEDLEIGKPIKQELLDAIEKSWMAVIILSKDYASSTWCLEELAKIVQCMEEREMRVLPIFYHVDPSDVRSQRGAFADAFAKHDKRFKENKEKVQTWRCALTEVANLSGRHLKDGPESKFIKSIVEMVFCELSNTLSIVDEGNLVGIDYQVDKMDAHLDMESNDVRFIGICGMSGMGKTTLARVVFQRICHLFQASIFLENVSVDSKRRGLDALQEKLLSHLKLKSDKEKRDIGKGINVTSNRLRFKKVLIILDDVDEKEQLETLAGDCDWFGPGSRIIITTHDRHLLKSHRVKNVYMIKGLDEYDDALDLQLFCQEAFCKPNCEKDFLDLCKDFVYYASGHPLALKVLGSSLLGKGRAVWESALDRLKAIPDKRIQNKLKIGFDALGDTEKKIFLDIACFFNGEDKARIVDILEGSDCYPNIDIETLVDKSLITILGGKLWMHNLLQKMGWEIVRSESRQKLGKCSRLWLRDDIFQVLRENTGTYVVEGIMLNMPLHKEQLNAKAFSNMKNLRLLKMCNVHLPAGLHYLSNKLRLMEWDDYPLISMPRSFQPDNLVELIMPHSRFEQIPDGISNLNKLKLMDLSDSENLIMTPDFSGFPNLQRLIFQGCTKLCEVHSSIGALNQLSLLNLKDCICLTSLPPEINLESLKICILSGCSRLKKFPEIGRNMKRLLELYLDGTAVEELPLSIQNLTGLTFLSLRDCLNLLSFPSIICSLTSLKTLILSGCKGQPPKAWYSLLSLVISSTDVTLTFLLPKSFSGLSSLVALDLSDCNLMDGALPNDLSCLSSLESLNLSRNHFTRLPDSISQLSKLKFLYLDNCSRLQSLPNLPSSVQFVMARGCTSLENYSNQVVVWTSGQTGFTIINCLSLSDDEESKVSEICLLDTHFQPLLEEQMHQSEGFYSVSENGIPKWFSHQKRGSTLSILLPSDLSKNNGWRGIALCAVLVANDAPGHDSNNVHELICRLDMDGGGTDYTVVFNVLKDQSHAGSFGLCLYASNARLREQLDERSCISPSITTNSPSVEIVACGARILYEQDMVDFVLILSQKNFGRIPQIFVPLAVPEDSHDALESSLSTSLNKEFDGCFVYIPRFSEDVLDWFSPHSNEPSVKIDIPESLYNDSDWIGLSVCAYFSVHEHPTAVLENPSSAVSHRLICSLESDVAGSEYVHHVHCTTGEEIVWLHKLGEFLWLSYIPRGSFPDWVNRCRRMKASITSDWPGLMLQKCGLRFLHKHDEEEFEQVISFCNMLKQNFISEVVGRAAFNKKRNEQNLDDGAEIRITSISHEDLHHEISGWPIYPGETSGAKNQQLCQNDPHPENQGDQTDLSIIDNEKTSKPNHEDEAKTSVQLEAALIDPTLKDKVKGAAE